MALVSPGVSVTVTDESFFIPVSAPTVPLLFVATADEKLRADNTTDAEGTFEHSVVRTITSLRQSTPTKLTCLIVLFFFKSSFIYPFPFVCI